VLGFGVSVCSLVVEQRGLWRVVREVALESSGRYDHPMTNAAERMPFEAVLEAAERLSPEEQENLAAILQHNQAERGRKRVALDVAEACEDLDRGGRRRSSPDELIGEIRS